MSDVLKSSFMGAIVPTPNRADQDDAADAPLQAAANPRPRNAWDSGYPWTVALHKLGR
jgi:hypothetical protein